MTSFDLMTNHMYVYIYTSNNIPPRCAADCCLKLFQERFNLRIDTLLHNAAAIAGPPVKSLDVPRRVAWDNHFPTSYLSSAGEINEMKFK